MTTSSWVIAIDHVPFSTVLEPAQLGLDLVVASALPHRSAGWDDRHLQLLAADRVLLLADDLLDSLVDPEAEGAGANTGPIPAGDT